MTEPQPSHNPKAEAGRRRPARETLKKPERNREKISEIFNRRFADYSNAMEELRKKPNLTPEEQLQLFRFDATKYAKVDYFDQGKNSLKHDLKGSGIAGELQIEEGLAVDGLIDFLHDQINPNQANWKELMQIWEDYNFLTNNADFFNSAHQDITKDSVKFQARIDVEANFFKQFRERNGFEGDELSDQDMARRALTLRRELKPESSEERVEAEQKFSRQDVWKVFKESFNDLGKKVQALQAKPKEELSEKDKQLLEEYSATRNSLNNANNRTHEVKLDWENEGQRYADTEGIPINSVLDFLQSEITELEIEKVRNPGEKINEKISDYQKKLDILRKNSLKYEDAKAKRALNQPANFEHARTALEAQARSTDELRRATDSSDSERMLNDWLQAEKELKRRTELNLPPEDKPNKIAAKDKSPGATPESKGAKQGRKKEGKTKDSEKDGVTNNGEDLSEAPSAKKGGKKDKGELSPLPTGKKGEGQDGKGELEAVPGSKKEEPKAKGKPTGAPPSTEPKPELAPLDTEWDAAFVTDDSATPENIAELGLHDRAQNKPASKNIGQRLLMPVLHPITFLKNAWQNSIFDDAFRKQANLFAMRLTQTARKVAGLDVSAPLFITKEVLDEAKSHGKEIVDKAGGMKKLGYRVRNFFAGIFASVQTSEMNEAVNWLKDSGQELVKGLKQHSLTESGNFARRFAINDKNENVIHEKVGEKRYRLEELITDVPVRTEIQTKLKGFLEKYATTDLSDEDFLKEINRYYHSDILKRVSADKLKELKGLEIATTLLDQARKLRSEEDVPGVGKKKLIDRYKESNRWEEVNLNVYLGTGKFETTRGEIGLHGFEKRLINYILERDYKHDQKIMAGAVDNESMIWSQLGYGALYAATFGLATAQGAAMNIGRSKLLGFLHLNPVTVGLAATGVLSTVREGVVINIKGGLVGYGGKTLKDFEQISREKAQGREAISGAVLRTDFETALVDQWQASDLTADINKFAKKEGDLSPEERNELLLHIAHAKARIDLTDTSTLSGKGFGRVRMVQNLIGYTEGKRNQELTELHSAISNGVTRLAGTEEYKNLDKARKVMEAQLTVGSKQEQVEMLVARELNMTQADAHTLTESYLKILDLKIDNQAKLSLDKARSNLAWLAAGKAGASALTTVLVAPIIGAEFAFLKHGVENVFGTGVNIGRTMMLEGTDGFRQDFNIWKQEWSDIWQGNVPMSIDKNTGEVVTDISKTQAGLIKLDNWLEPPVFAKGHDVEVDGLDIRIPEHWEIKEVDLEGNDGQPDHEVLIDLNKREVIADLTDTTFKVNEVNGVKELVVVDKGGNETDLLEKLGINIKVVEDKDLFDDEDRDQGEKEGVEAENKATIEPPTPEVVEEKVNGNEVWSKAESNRVVHPSVIHEGAEPPPAMSNTVFRTDDETHQYGVRFEFPDNMIHNPNTGATVHLMDAAADGKVGMLLEIPHYGTNEADVSIFVPAHWDAGLNRFVVNFDPTDTETKIELPDGNKISMAALSRLFLNENKIAELGEGFSGTELAYETRAAFNLANPDGLIEHQGRIHAGVKSEEAYLAVHSVHGSEPVNMGEVSVVEGPPVVVESGADVEDGRGLDDLFDKKDTVDDKDVTFILEPKDTGKEVVDIWSWDGFTKVTGLDQLSIPVIPIHSREPIEKSVNKNQAQAQAASTVTPPAGQPSDGTEKEDELSPDRRAELETKREELLKEQKRLQDAIESAKQNSPEGKPDPETERRLSEVERELEELNATLKPPKQEDETHSENKSIINFTKEDYERQIVHLKRTLQEQDLKTLNEAFEAYKFDKLSQEQLDAIRKDEKSLENLAKDLFIVQIPQIVITELQSVDNSKEMNELREKIFKSLPLEIQGKFKIYQTLQMERANLEKQLREEKDKEKQELLKAQIKTAKDTATEFLQEDKERVVMTNIEKVNLQANQEFIKNHQEEIIREANKIRESVEAWESSVEVIGKSKADATEAQN